MAKEKKPLVLPSQKQMFDNIVRTYAQATDFDMDSGLHWYDRTREYIRQYADMFGYPLENVVGAYAVISPSLSKELNDLQIIDLLIAHKGGLPFGRWLKVGTYGMPNKLKAKRCLDGDLSAVGGDKVTSFFENILGRGDNRVTVDRWALRVACDDPEIMDTQGLTSKQYQACRQAYMDASETLGVKPLQVQAVTWECFRNKYYRKSGDVDYKPV